MKANFPTKSHTELATQMNEVFIKLNYAECYLKRAEVKIL